MQIKSEFEYTGSDSSSQDAALSMLTMKQQSYLETIYELSIEQGHTHIKDIAHKLTKSMPTVTEVMKKLSQKGYILYDVRKNISLTNTGMQMARELDERHKILADFYNKILGCPTPRAQKIACQVEHIVDTAFCSRLAGFASFLRQKETEDIDLIKEFQDHYKTLKTYE